MRRWSRRKARATQDQGKILHGRQEDVGADSKGDMRTQLSEATDADMPPIDSLDADSNYAQFLSPKVSDRLRRAALRKLFHLPDFNVTDGLDDYAADYRELTALSEIVAMERIREMESKAKAALERATGASQSPSNSAKQKTQIPAVASDPGLSSGADTQEFVETDEPVEGDSDKGRTHE